MTTVDTRTNGSITWETRTSTRDVRYNGKCRACKSHHTALVTRSSKSTYRSDMIKCVSQSSTETCNGRPWSWGSVECCGKAVTMKAVKGVRNDEIECGAKCRSSKGHVCECSCGGKNHGAG
jgi:hypothetical protein